MTSIGDIIEQHLILHYLFRCIVLILVIILILIANKNFIELNIKRLPLFHPYSAEFLVDLYIK